MDIKKLKFLEDYFSLCTEHGYYIDSARSSDDLRIFPCDPDTEEWDDGRMYANNALLRDVGIV